MIAIERTNDRVIFTVRGLDKLFAFKSALDIPVEHITAVYPGSDIEINFFDSLKLLGTDLPKIFRAGTFYQNGETVFWDVRNTTNVIVVELNHEFFRKLVIEVENPEEAIKMIKGKLPTQF